MGNSKVMLLEFSAVSMFPRPVEFEMPIVERETALDVVTDDDTFPEDSSDVAVDLVCVVVAVVVVALVLVLL